MSKARFNLKNKKENSTLILLVYRFNSKKLVFSTGLSISPSDWNDRTMRVRDTAGNIECGIINDSLDELEEKINSIHREFRRQGLDPTVRQLKQKLLFGSDGCEKKANLSVKKFIDQFIDERENSPKYSPGSIQVYKTTKKHFNSYCRNQVIEFSDLTHEFLKGFIKYLYAQDFSDNHVNKVFSTLRTILNDATDRNLNQNLAYKSRKLKVPKRETDHVYLTVEELRKLEKIDLTDNPKLDRVKDLFLIGAWTGLRYSDFSSLTENNLKNVDDISVFEVNTVKTNDKLIIPIHPVVLRILEKYNGPPFPISNQKMNLYLKEICQLAGITERITKRLYIGGRRREEQFYKWELIGSHTARRSFATNAYKAGIDAISIMKITGHKKYEMFMKYIKVDKKENALRMGNHHFFNGF